MSGSKELIVNLVKAQPMTIRGIARRTGLNPATVRWHVLRDQCFEITRIGSGNKPVICIVSWGCEKNKNGNVS